MAGSAAIFYPVKISGAIYRKLPAKLLSELFEAYRPLMPKSTTLISRELGLAKTILLSFKSLWMILF